MILQVRALLNNGMISADAQKQRRTRHGDYRAMQIPKSSRNYATPKLAQYRQLVQLTVETLATAITTAIQDQGIGDRAAALGEKIRSENGVAHAVEIIEKKMNKRV